MEYLYSHRLGKLQKELIHRMLGPGVLNDGKAIDYALGLIFSHYKGYPHQPLEPTMEDRFLLFDNHLKFLRDNKGKVNAFTMNAGRVRNILFLKEAP